MPIPVSTSPHGPAFAVRVVPRAGRTSVAGTRGDALLVRLAAAPVDWRRKAVVLCDVAQDRAALAPLADRGAATASLAPLEGFDAKRLLVEGDPAALAALRRLLAHGDVKLVELRGQSKAAYLAGIRFLTSFSAPLLAAASDCLRLSGLSSRVAAKVVERLSQRTLRTHLKGGKRSAAGPLARELDALQRISPWLAASYASASRLTRDGA